MSIRKKPLAALKTNVRELPYQIGRWKHNGEADKVVRAQRIYDECRAEITRRARAG